LNSAIGDMTAQSAITAVHASIVAETWRPAT